MERELNQTYSLIIETVNPQPAAAIGWYMQT